MKEKRLRMPAWIVVVLLSFGLMVLGVSVNEVKGEQITIKEGEVTMEKEVVELGKEEMVMEEAVDYYLPYPGILPDHPMYWLKMIRDRVQLWLVGSSEAKAEKLLANADKRLGAGFQLIEGNKISLGVTTLTKAEKYLEQATQLGMSQEGALDLQKKLMKASQKHVEVLKLIREKTGDEHRGVVEQMIMMNEVRGTQSSNQGYRLMIDGVETVIEFEVTEAMTALELLQEGAKASELEVKIKEYDFGSLVEAIGEKENTKEKAWIYYVNGEPGTQAADMYQLKSGDLIEWKYIPPTY